MSGASKTTANANPRTSGRARVLVVKDAIGAHVLTSTDNVSLTSADKPKTKPKRKAPASEGDNAPSSKKKKTSTPIAEPVVDTHMGDVVASPKPEADTQMGDGLFRETSPSRSETAAFRFTTPPLINTGTCFDWGEEDAFPSPNMTCEAGGPSVGAAPSSFHPAPPAQDSEAMVQQGEEASMVQPVKAAPSMALPEANLSSENREDEHSAKSSKKVAPTVSIEVAEINYAKPPKDQVIAACSKIEFMSNQGKFKGWCNMMSSSYLFNSLSPLASAKRAAELKLRASFRALHAVKPKLPTDGIDASAMDALDKANEAVLTQAATKVANAKDEATWACFCHAHVLALHEKKLLSENNTRNSDRRRLAGNSESLKGKQLASVKADIATATVEITCLEDTIAHVAVYSNALPEHVEALAYWNDQKAVLEAEQTFIDAVVPAVRAKVVLNGEPGNKKRSGAKEAPNTPIRYLAASCLLFNIGDQYPSLKSLLVQCFKAKSENSGVDFATLAEVAKFDEKEWVLPKCLTLTPAKKAKVEEGAEGETKAPVVSRPRSKMDVLTMEVKMNMVKEITRFAGSTPAGLTPEERIQAIASMVKEVHSFATHAVDSVALGEKKKAAIKAINDMKDM